MSNETQPNEPQTVTISLEEYRALKNRTRPRQPRQKYRAIDGEEWRAFPGSQVYFVSNMGRFRKVFRDRSNRQHDFILRTTMLNGAMRVTLTLEPGTVSGFQCARVILTIFDSDHPELYPVFADGDPSNLKLSNLFWGTLKEAREYRLAAGTVRPRLQPKYYIDVQGKRGTKFVMLSDNDKAEIRRLYHDEGMTQTAIGEQFGISQTYVGRILKHQR